ncbi:SGM_5486 family transporter-associated protein [Streptomyces palmae]|nr:SGM_5486 family transporter-associated protein [Streptomyces palmae]
MSPVLDPQPQNGQKKLLTILGVMLLITLVIGVIATIAAP